VNQRSRTPGDRLPLLIAIGVFAVMLACLPLVWLLDGTVDEDRPMYQDMLRMQSFQTVHIANGGQPVEATVADGETVAVGSSEFIASPGVKIVVRAVDADSYCIRASNDLGEKSSERCSE